MKTYLVGGAVRDKCLGFSPKEMDWVVVGATADEMLSAGFNKVGKDFPVFLHPQTREEYALARTERKSGKGYYGFEVFASPEVTLEQDLLRRDLTINAMAEDQDGHIIDPYGGQSDCKARLLRHVSPAFVEDPLRLLRLGRFQARFHHLGFRLADETRQLLCDMVRNNECTELVAERVWQEWQRSLTEKNPEQFILLLRQCGALQQLLPELDALFGVPNPPQYHPEIDSGVHTLMVLQAACQLSTLPQLRFAALLHDLGKAKTPMIQWPRHRQHENTGLPLIRNLCERLKVPATYRDLALLVCEHHLTIHRYAELRPATRIKLLEKTDAFRRSERFEQLLLACQADAMGADYQGVYPQYQQWRYLLAECDKIQVSSILEQGFSGPQVKDELRLRRIICAKLIDNKQDHHEK